MKQSKESKVTLSTQMASSHAEIVKKAAEKAGFNVSTFLRNVALQFSAKELSIVQPDLSMYATRNLIKTAARRLGMGVDEFMKMAAEEVAKAQLSRMG